MLRIAVPVATILFCWLTVRSEVTFQDFGTFNLYGFPLPWHRWSGVSSLETLVDLPALATDFLMAVLLCSALLRAAPIQPLTRRLGPTPLLLLWAAAAISVGWLALGLYPPGLELGAVADLPHSVGGFALHLGTHYPY